MSTDCFSLPKAFTIVCPVYISSTCPLSSPKVRCCPLKYCWERAAIILVPNMLSGKVTMVANVSSGLIVSIMMIIPINVTTDVISCVKLCCIVEEIVSTSFVARLIVSPWLLASKKESGTRVSFSLISLRRLKTIFCVTVTMMRCWTYKSIELNT
ncbi:hypothetical protein D3C86_1771730 [compost metagenome]